MDLTSPVFVGFFPKRTERKTDWISNPAVAEICSVSLCFSQGPEDWIERWEHNHFGFYNSEELAHGILGREELDFDLYAYKMYCLSFDGGEVHPYPSPVRLERDLSAFELLGHDAVNRSEPDAPNVQCSFDCSPLSCNNAASIFPVNRHCLITDLDDAYRTCIAISKGAYEPGPYSLFEIYRRKVPRRTN